MTIDFSPERSDAIRAGLVSRVAMTQTRRRRPLWATALVVAGALAGAGVATAAFAASGSLSASPESPGSPAGQPTPGLGDAVTAPAGTEPGSPVLSMLGDQQSLLVDESVEVSLADRPDAATHARVTLTAVTAGTIGWGTDPGGDNPSASFGTGDLGGDGAVTWYDFPLDDSADRLYFELSGTASATVTVQYLLHVPTHLGVNARGETYGVEGGPDGTPDLVRVEGTAPDGSPVEGYARSADLGAFSPEHPEQPSSPAEALEGQEERDARHPDGRDVPVYESDGETVIGTFRIG